MGLFVDGALIGMLNSTFGTCFKKQINSVAKCSSAVYRDRKLRENKPSRQHVVCQENSLSGELFMGV